MWLEDKEETFEDTLISNLSSKLSKYREQKEQKWT